MKVLSALFLAAGLLCLPAQQVAACSCGVAGIEESAAIADAVFAGTVTDQQQVGLETGPVGAMAATAPGPIPFGQVLYSFAVDGVAKGEIGPVATVVAGSDGASCGMTFAVGERWLVFTSWDGAAHSTGLCSGNIPLGSDEDPPVPLTAPNGDIPPATAPEVPWPLVALAGVLLLVVAVSYVAFRRDSPAMPS